MNRYAPHSAYISPALNSTGLARLVIGYALIEAIYYVAQRIFSLVLILIGETMGPPRLEESYAYGDTALGLLLQLFSFGFLAIAIIGTVYFHHSRSGWSLLGRSEAFLRTLVLSTLVCAAILLVIEILPPRYDLSGGNFQPIRLLILPLSLLAILVQTGAEEMLYRGYLQQQLAAQYKSPWVWMIAPNVMFALAHLDLTGDPVLALQYVVWAFVFGLICSDLTARTGNLAAAIGFHLANNAYVFLFWAESRAPDSGLALLLYPAWDGHEPYQDLPWVDLIFISDLGVPLVLWLGVRLVLRR